MKPKLGHAMDVLKVQFIVSIHVTQETYNKYVRGLKFYYATEFCFGSQL